MNLIADTNVLARAIAGDDPVQSPIAQSVLASADSVAVTLPALCELVWVLTRAYKESPSSIANAIRRLIASDNVHVNRPAVEAGLAVMDLGGDFADGVIAYEGQWLGGDLFASFDHKAVALLRQGGAKTWSLAD